MSFYDELADEYKADVDPITGLSRGDLEKLEYITEFIKQNILYVSREGGLHTDIALGPTPLFRAVQQDLYYLVSHKRDLVITYLQQALGVEFTIDIGMEHRDYSRLYLNIDWVAPNKKEMELQ